MVWFFLILYLITLAECNYGFIGYSEKAFAEEKSPCTFAVASTQSGNQDPPAARAQEGVWDSPETSFARRKLFGASLRKRWRSPQWTGVALRAGGQTKPTRRSVPAVGSSGHMETTQHTFRRRSNQRAQEGVLSLGTTQDGTAEGTGTMHPGQRTGKTMDRLRGAIDAGTLRGKRRPRRSRRTSKVSIQCRHQNHPGILSTGGIK